MASYTIHDTDRREQGEDLIFCESNNRDEGKVSNLTMIRSVLLPKVANAAKDRDDYKN